MPNVVDEMEAKNALDAIGAARATLIEKARWPVARHVGFGLAMGGLVGAYSLPDGLPILAVAMCLAVIALMVAQDRKRDGFFVSGYRRGRTRWVTLTVLFFSLLALLGGAMLKYRFGIVWAPAALGFLIFVLATAGSFLWERVYRVELGSNGN
jgi:hypothetical protein